LEEKFYKPKEFAKLINQSVSTLQRWDNKGLLKAHRTPTNRRYYTHTQYVEYMKEKKEGLTMADGRIIEPMERFIASYEQNRQSADYEARRLDKEPGYVHSSYFLPGIQETLLVRSQIAWSVRIALYYMHAFEQAQVIALGLDRLHEDNQQWWSAAEECRQLAKKYLTQIDQNLTPEDARPLGPSDFPPPVRPPMKLVIKEMPQRGGTARYFYVETFSGEIDLFTIPPAATWDTSFKNDIVDSIGYQLKESYSQEVVKDVQQQAREQMKNF